MKLSDFSVTRPVTAAMIFVATIVLGYVSYTKMSLDLFPDIELPVAVVMINYPNVGPQEIESTVTRPIEETLAGINNIDTITSNSKEGFSLVIVRFAWGTDMSLAVSDIRERIDITKGFLPDEVDTPIVLKFDVSMMPIMVLSVSADKNSSEIREFAEDKLKNQFEQIDGVASATITGGEKNEVKVDLIKNRMDAYSISIDQIINTLRSENLNVSGGEILSPGRKFSVRTIGEYKSIRDIENVVVAVKNMTPIYLRDLAGIYEASEEKTEVVRLNQESGIIIRLNKQSDKNTVLISRNILSQIEKIKRTLPRGMEIKVIMNTAEFIEQAMDNVVNNAAQGGVIAVLVVFIFLRNIRSALILGLSIPISIIATFIMMYFAGISLNMMSMGGLALGVGMLIDNSIVIMENIFRFREKGARATEAAKLGADEMGLAITASTLTTIVVFIPFFFTEGLAAQLFRQMALTISFSLICSLIVALTLIPMLSAKFITTTHPEYTGRLSFIKSIFIFSENLFSRLDIFYTGIIDYSLKNRKKVVLYTGAAVVAGLILIPVAGLEYMPEQDDARLTFMVKLPVGTNLNTTEKTIKEIEQRAVKVIQKNEYIVMSTRAGSGSGFTAAFGETTDNTSKFEFRLVRSSKRKRGIQELKEALRVELKDMPGVIFNFSPRQGVMMGMGGSQIIVEVYGYDLVQAKKFVSEIHDKIKNVEGLTDIEISREEGLPELNIIINREKASKSGLSSYYIASTIQSYMAGKTATRYRKSGKEHNITVRLREEDRKTLEDIKGLMIATPTGHTVPLGNFIDVVEKSGPTTIERQKQERVTYINCKAVGRDLNSVVNDMQDEIDSLVKPPNFYVDITGSYKDMKDTFKDLALALLLAIVLIYIIMAAQFESFSAPFLIMFSVPTLIFGVAVFLFLTGTTFSVVAFMGVLMLAGIVVNNAIVYVDYTNILRARGLNLHDALIEAGRSRLRPILMTTFTTILGLIPMAIGTGDGSELSAPLARTVIGGMSSSFIFTLIFIPVVYSLFESFKNKMEDRRAQRSI
jgi:HAE1 family hydrophobic/amphiphilic exporter-1